MKKNSLVKIRKLSAVESPALPTPVAADYVPGSLNSGVSLPIDYEVEATLLEDIVVGEALKALRHKRNGIPVIGIFESSEVQSIEPQEDSTIVKTANSCYEVVELSPPDINTVPV